MEKEDFIVIAKITGVHGLKGKLKVYSYSGTLSSIKPGIKVLVKIRGEKKFLTVSEVSEQKKNFLILFDEITTIDDAKKITGSKILIENSALPELQEGIYYWKDLIGLKVNSVEGDFYGEIKTIMETGSNDVYVVKDGKSEILIPAIASVVKKIDLDQGIVLVELPEGLLDL
ncbi:MAG: 16S rRNA processing protein RimM [Deltaproteobacteria bacterium]|nr:16S rRNA processing protein RimM [Deltaproteobacteria bacterium]